MLRAVWNVLIGKNPARVPSGWRVAVVDDAIAVTAPIGVTAKLRVDQIVAIVIETNDRGPLEDDVWWSLSLDSGHTIRFPQSADGEQSVVKILSELPGFDFEQMNKAMGSTENATFSVWNRS
jgi:hypothetical protein